MSANPDGQFTEQSHVTTPLGQFQVAPHDRVRFPSGIPGGDFIITGVSVITDFASLPAATSSIFTLSVSERTTPKGRTPSL